MCAKTKRGEYEPSWTEVTIGALLSVVIGASLGVAYLVFKPVMTFKDGKSTTISAKVVTPKPGEKVPKPGETVVTQTEWKPAPGDVLYFEGSSDSAKARLAPAKRKTFVGGGSVSVDEHELNSIVASALAAKPAPGAKPAPAPGAATAADASGLTPETPNFRIHEGEFQIGIPMRVAAMGFDTKVIVQARGQFVKRGERFVFEPSTLTVGSCPVDPLPVLRSLVVRKVLNAVPVPEDIAGAWGKLSEVAVVGSALKLTMP